MPAGKGTYIWKVTGAIYDGDWKKDKRCGFGTYSVKKGGDYVKEYAGGWKNNMRHVSELSIALVHISFFKVRKSVLIFYYNLDTRTKLSHVLRFSLNKLIACR